MKIPKILVINGPNLSRLGKRKPSIYGTDTLEDIEARLNEQASVAKTACSFFCSNSEGLIVDFLNDNCSADGLIFNPGALMMNGWSLRDALEDFSAPIIEVHISNIWAREAFRHQSILSSEVTGVIVGLGTAGYDLAMTEMIKRLQ